ncbi:hypothetical protein [Limimaricola pyoseonensis]|uniref:hypothetical protein n=1 Tax=Limimaricola pyoseonensis TaxID=521013 RepID=UPI0010426B3E|nr:hypothetical protein [Limimaricola pyoseonensis]
MNWEVLGAVGRSRLAAISILMPFIGYAILYNDQVMKFLESVGLHSFPAPTRDMISAPDDRSWGKWLEGVLDLSVIARLNFLYVGSFLLGLGTIVFKIIAPSTIQQHSSIEAFFNSELERASARRLRTMVRTIRHRRPQVAANLINAAPWLDREKRTLKIAYAEMREQGDSQIQADVLSSFYNVESRYYRRAGAFSVAAIYVSAFSLISIPGLCFTLQVLLSMLP